MAVNMHPQDGADTPTISFALPKPAGWDILPTLISAHSKTQLHTHHHNHTDENMQSPRHA